MYPFSPAPDLWHRRLSWATHSADVRFVQYSMQANRLVQSAEAAASTLRSSSVSEQTRNDVRSVLEATVRRLVPLEKAQGTVLLGLGRTMLSAVGSIYLGREDAVATRRDSDTSIDEDEADKPTPEVPENDLVRETRQVLIRGKNGRTLHSTDGRKLTLRRLSQPPACSKTATPRSCARPNRRARPARSSASSAASRAPTSSSSSSTTARPTSSSCARSASSARCGSTQGWSRLTRSG